MTCPPLTADSNSLFEILQRAVYLQALFSPKKLSSGQLAPHNSRSRTQITSPVVMDTSCSEFNLCESGRQIRITQTVRRLAILMRLLIRTPRGGSLWIWQIEMIPEMFNSKNRICQRQVTYSCKLKQFQIRHNKTIEGQLGPREQILPYTYLLGTRALCPGSRWQ